ncbi:Fc.00g043070.m01.CDS01 [Cosmosporella sp. VM-42]
MTIQIPSIGDFGISPTRGFLSSTPPPTNFCHPKYSKWDELISKLSELISSHALSESIDSLPILDTSELASEFEYRRAYVVLGFLVHAYVWGGSKDGKPIGTVPPQLSEPFLKVCEVIGMHPVLSYAGLTLWNWKVNDGQNRTETGFYELEHLQALASFMNVRGEDAFYHVPVLIEAEGGPLVPLLLSALTAADKGETSSVITALKESAEILKRMGQHLPKLYPTLDAHMFYHELRPFLAGGQGMDKKGLPHGMVFRRSNGSEQAVKCIGGSAAQSTLFQFLDLVLGVEHKAPESGSKTVFQVWNNINLPEVDKINANQEMREYMPSKHREFLEAVSKLPTIRCFVQRRLADEVLSVSYEDCLKHLRLWRGKHIAVVSKYVVQPARQEEKEAQVAQGRADGLETGEEKSLQGTAGTELVPFLRQSRDETVGFEVERKQLQ